MGGAYDYELLGALNQIADSAERAAAALEKLSPPGGKDQEAIMFGFSPAGFNQVLVFIGDEPPQEIVAANPRMGEILRNDGHNIYIWGLKAEAS